MAIQLARCIVLGRESGGCTFRVAIIFLAIDPFNEFNFFGLFNSIVLNPYIELNMTSSGSSPSIGFVIVSISVLLAYYPRIQYMTKSFVGDGRSLKLTSRLVCNAPGIIFALRGMVGVIRRVQDVSGLEARSMEVRRDIGSRLSRQDRWLTSGRWLLQHATRKRVGE